MTIHSEQILAFAFLALMAIIILTPAKAPPETAAAVAEYPAPDYRDAVIDALHAEIVELERRVAQWEEHHEAVHRGECVPRPDWN